MKIELYYELEHINKEISKLSEAAAEAWNNDPQENNPMLYVAAEFLEHIGKELDGVIVRYLPTETEEVIIKERS